MSMLRSEMLILQVHIFTEKKNMGLFQWCAVISYLFTSMLVGNTLQ